MVTSKTLYGLYLVARLAYAEDLKEKVSILKKMAALIYSHLKNNEEKKAEEWKKNTIDKLAELEVDLVQLEEDMAEVMEDLRRGWLLEIPDQIKKAMVRINKDVATIEADVLNELNKVLGEVKEAEISVASDVAKLLGSKRKVREEEWEDVPDL